MRFRRVTLRTHATAVKLARLYGIRERKAMLYTVPSGRLEGRAGRRQMIERRTFLAGSAALAASGTTVNAQHQVPNSAGSDAPKLKAPANACDCHMHIYDGERFPPARPGPQSRMQENAAVAQYRLLQQRLGTTRTVIVTPAAYVTDNRVTLDGIEQLGREKTRGVAVVHPTVTDAELKQMNDGGIRGIRFTVFDPRSA